MDYATIIYGGTALIMLVVVGFIVTLVILNHRRINRRNDGRAH